MGDIWNMMVVKDHEDGLQKSLQLWITFPGGKAIIQRALDILFQRARTAGLREIVYSLLNSIIKQDQSVIENQPVCLGNTEGWSGPKISDVIYLCTRTSPFNYVDKITWELRRCIGEHIGDIRHAWNTQISRHVLQKHVGDIHSISGVMEVVTPFYICENGDNNIDLLIYWVWLVHLDGLNKNLL